MIHILNYIYKNTQLAASLGFKGGTAAYLFYDLPRFSTDLDFDLINPDVETSEIQNLINEYVGEKYEILDEWDKHYTTLWKLSYEKGLMNIKIEISKRDAASYEFEYKNLYGNSIRVIIPEHLIVQKLIALRNREIMANRDIFDANFFLKSQYASNIDYEVLEEITQKSRKDFMKELKTYLEEREPRNILDGLGEVVEEEKKEWIRNEMFDETLELIQMQIDSL